MSDKIWLYYGNQGFGPGAVARNLEAGLKEIGAEVVKKPGKADYLGCLQYPGQLIHWLPETTLMGPNLFVVPPENPEICQKFNNFVVPSKWVKNLYEKFPHMKNKQIDVWPVGIDTEKWKPPSLQQAPLFDYFIYQKNTPGPIAEQINVKLKEKYGFKSGGWLTYGHYQEQDLKESCDKCKFAILVTDTESQGIAYSQILSTGTPCFVVNKEMWKYQGKSEISSKASSVPYFDDRCGAKVPSRGLLGMTEEDEDKLDSFVKKAMKNLYSPQDYILENHTLAQGAQEYLTLLKKAKEEC